MLLFITRLTLFIFLTLLSFKNSFAQLCQGSLGDPVVNITFGSGNNPGPALSPGTTNMNFISTDCPRDGNYTIENRTSLCFNNTWHTLTRDHTGDANGYFMLINASYEPSDFYVSTVKGLCGGTTYEFAAWITNVLVQRNWIRPNITFSIEKTDGTVLQTFNSGNIDETPTAQWKQYGFFFSTPADVFEVVLRMRNNAPGGNGNDVALDDITFRPCGPLVTAHIEGISKDTTLCEGTKGSLTFQASVSAGYVAPVYQWQIKGGNGTWQDIPGASTNTYRWLPSTGTGVSQYRLTVSSAGNSALTGCRVASNPVTVNVQQNPKFSTAGSVPQCEGTDYRIAGKVDFFGPDVGKLSLFGPGYNGNITVSQTPGNGAILFDHTIKSASFSNAAQIYLLATSNNGCTGMDSVSPVINLKPVALFDAGAGCENAPINFVDKSDGNLYTITKWTWNFGSGNIASTRDATHRFLKPGTYPVSLQVETDQNCKSDLLTKSVVIYELPAVDFGLPQICISDPFAQFQDSSTISDASQRPFTYFWDFGDGTNAPGQNTSSVKDPQHRYLATGRYNVNLKVTSASGCKNEKTKIFTVNGAQPVATFVVENKGRLCSKEAVRITNDATVDFGSVTRIEIFWDDANPLLKTIDYQPAAGKKYIHKYPDSGSAQSSITIRYVAYSGINCAHESRQVILLNRSPEVVFPPLAAVCEETPAFSIAATERSGLGGIGVFAGAGVSANGSFSPALARPGNHNLQFIYTTDRGCSDTVVQTIMVNARPLVNAGADLTVLKGSATTINATLSGNGATVLWTPGIYLDNTKIINPKTTPLNETLYTVTAVSADGCTSKDDVLVRVVDKLYIPNAFTPDGDRLNDLWTVPYLNSISDMDVKVFNRAGKVVFHTSNVNKGWDGKLNGKDQPSGAYVYLIETKANNLRISGTLILVR